MADWEPLPDGVTSKCSGNLFMFDATGTSLEERYGPPQFKDEDSNGLGLVDAWCLRFPCGIEVGLWKYHMRSDGEMVREVESEDELHTIEVFASEPERDHLLFHLGLTVDEISPWEPGPPIGEKVWRVMRQDDNGNTAEITRVTSKCEAEAIAKDFEARGHKQMYWAERSQ